MIVVVIFYYQHERKRTLNCSDLQQTVTNELESLAWPSAIISQRRGASVLEQKADAYLVVLSPAT